MKGLEIFLDKLLGPVANKMGQSKFFSALSEAFMRTTPITLGAAFLMLIGNFPIPAWINWLKSIGMDVHFTAVVGATFNALALYVAFNFAYVYVRKSGENGLTAGLLSMASFLLLAPQIMTVPTLQSAVAKFPAKATVTGIQSVEAFQTAQTGGPGLIVAIIVGFLTGVMFLFFKKKNLVVKLPSTVPPSVSESLNPTFIAGLIFSVFFIIRVGLSYTAFGNVFNLIYGILQAPLEALTSSPISIIIIYTLANLFWFFGIHPSVVYGIVTPMLMANFTANTNAYISTGKVPYLMMAIIYIFTSNAFGGQGGTYGLILSMIRAKSARYKELFKLAAAPTLFNINEPIIFGMPIMLNPMFFLPMIFGPIVQGGIAWLVAIVLKVGTYNAAIQMPWTLPTPINAFFLGGWKFLVIAIAVMVGNFFLWYPFFRVADKKEVEAEEKANIAA